MRNKVIKMTWNLENLKLEDFGLLEEDNMLTAPLCPCGCGGKTRLLLEEEDDVIGFCYSMVEEADCGHCVVFAITDQNYMLAAIRNGDGINVIKSKKPMDDYSFIGEMFYELELHIFGLIVSTGDGQYKIVEK